MPVNIEFGGTVENWCGRQSSYIEGHIMDSLVALWTGGKKVTE